MLAGRDSPSPMSSVLSEGEERMYHSALSGPDGLEEPSLPAEMFANAAQNHPADLGLEHEEQDSSEFTV